MSCLQGFCYGEWYSILYYSTSLSPNTKVFPLLRLTITSQLWVILCNMDIQGFSNIAKEKNYIIEALVIASRTNITSLVPYTIIVAKYIFIFKSYCPQFDLYVIQVYNCHNVSLMSCKFLVLYYDIDDMVI